MKICWDNLEKFIYNSKIGKWRNKNKHSYVYMESCKQCKNPYLIRDINISNFCSKSCSMIGKIHTEESKIKMSKSRSGKNHFMYGKKWSDEVKNNMKIIDAETKKIKKMYP